MRTIEIEMPIGQSEQPRTLSVVVDGNSHDFEIYELHFGRFDITKRLDNQSVHNDVRDAVINKFIDNEDYQAEQQFELERGN
jgi:hypothetical protein